MNTFLIYIFTTFQVYAIQKLWDFSMLIPKWKFPVKDLLKNWLFQFPTSSTNNFYVTNDFFTLIILPFFFFATNHCVTLKKKLFWLNSPKEICDHLSATIYFSHEDRFREECYSLNHCHLLQCIFLLLAVSKQLLKLVLVCMSVFLCILHHAILKHHQGRTLHPLAWVCVTLQGTAIILIDLQHPVCLYS